MLVSAMLVLAILGSAMLGSAMRPSSRLGRDQRRLIAMVSAAGSAALWDPYQVGDF
jgi:hypothetical protein